MAPDNQLIVKIGCLVEKTTHVESGLSYYARQSFRDFAVFETRLERPQEGSVTKEIVCEHCGASLPVVIRSRTFVVQRLLFIWLLFFVIPFGIAVVTYCQGGDTASLGIMIGILPVAALIVLIPRTVLYILDSWQGNATAALVWPEKTRRLDFNEQKKDFQHEFLSIRPG